jgi:Fur family ferric uptake transcriptional regulator
MTSREILKMKSLKATLQRIALLDTLRNTKNPLTVVELHERNTAKSDLVTIYRTLETFVKTALVRKIHLKGDPVRYEFASKHHHHHLVCTMCGIIDELPSCEVSELESRALKHSTRFASISEHALEFFGTCRACVGAV